ncbi:MAG TPA: hypothetical protein VFY29_21360 [Terriglobia bacterium]|nr:hypothetical protein [Terriglobia bacterium]
MRRTILTLSLIVAAFGLCLKAQSPTTTATQPPVYANLNQLMRGILYPAANVVFYPQFENPGDVKQADDPSMATDPIKSVFGGWQAIENASLALAESTTLLSAPGRVCSNGVPVPVTDPAWAGFVQEVRDAGLQAYKAAQAKDQEKMIELSEAVSNSCEHCHRRFRRGTANRCR